MENSFALKRIKDLMWVLAIAALVVGVGRFAFGLGAATNMLDALPWGLWKIFNMVAGAALATSGFMIAAVIYIFKLEKYRPVARLSVLVGFLGYGASLTALIFDIGLPHRGWHPFFIWNPHSFLFEVFWCVSCYWGVTALEVLPIVTERFRLKQFTHFIHENMLPFVVLGITLSTMHHSSLGSLFMTSPTRLHPLWFTMWLPPEYFVSAMGAGLSFIVLLSLLCSRLYGRERNMPVLTGLAKGSAALLLLYLVIKVVDFTVFHKWNFVFGPDFTWESVLFLVEISLQVLVPVALIATPRFRNSAIGLILATSSAFLGLLMHRIDTGIIGYFRSSDAVYIPNLSEFVLGLGVLSAAGIVFFFLVERFLIFDAPDEHAEHGEGDLAKPWTREEALSILKSPATFRVSFITILIIPITILCLHDEATGPFQPTAAPVTAPIGLDAMRTELLIDGNRTNESVIFPHDKHKEELGGDDSCVKCHHLSLPGDNNSSCVLCHRDMEVGTDIFSQERHRDREGSEDGDCLKCHKENMPGLETSVLKGFSHVARGYKEAMHGLCITCHRLKEKDPADPLGMGNCRKCHPFEEPGSE